MSNNKEGLTCFCVNLNWKKNENRIFRFGTVLVQNLERKNFLSFEKVHSFRLHLLEVLLLLIIFLHIKGSISILFIILFKQNRMKESPLHSIFAGMFTGATLGVLHGLKL